MKKLLVIILVLGMLLPLMGIAEVSVDVESMSYEELVALFERVQLALFGHSLTDGVQIPIGKYIVGKDIAAGGYVLGYTGDASQIHVKIWTPDGTNFDMWEILEAEESLKIHLREGATLELISIQKVTGTLTIKSFAGLFAK